MSEKDDILLALKNAGINDFFYDATGEKKTISLKARTEVLAAFNGLYQGNFKPRSKLQESLGDVLVYYPEDEQNLLLDEKCIGASWILILENGSKLTGKVGDGFALNSINFKQVLEFGYHKLTLKLKKITATATLISAPKKAYLPQQLENKQKLFGSCVQLYTLKSERNWGVGDFADLYDFIEKFALNGGDFVGINPIHALFPANPSSISPYSPSSRSWTNIIYLAPDIISGSDSAKFQDFINNDLFQQELAQCKAKDWIDYPAVMRIKLSALKVLFELFLENNEAKDEFSAYCAHHGESLHIQASFDALHAFLASQQENQYGWSNWAEKYQSYQSPAVKKFIKANPKEVEFYAWLQWQAHLQLDRCYKLCQKLNLPIGLYRDLAVGVSPSGAETWADKSLYCLDISVGAPPDVLGPQGQSWGLSPLNPHVLKRRAYQPFIQMIRANMQSCGALRLDHIMGLMRLWWIKQGDSAKNGVYVQYPLDDLLAILTLESVRHQCLIIGEDLGTVPDEIVAKLKNAQILSYKVFYFEFDNEGKSKALSDYTCQSMATLSTHDLPTVRGYWSEHDFYLGEKYGVYPDPKILQQLIEARRNAKQQFLNRLTENELAFSGDISGHSKYISTAFNHTLQSYLAKVNSALLGLQPEDWLDMLDPVNIPGTSDEYPNWQRRLSRNINDIFNDQAIINLLKQIKSIRSNL